MNSEDERAVDLIKGMLSDISRDVVQNAVIALYNILGDNILSKIINDESLPEKARDEALKLQDDLKEDMLDEEVQNNDE